MVFHFVIGVTQLGLGSTWEINTNSWIFIIVMPIGTLNWHCIGRGNSWNINSYIAPRSGAKFLVFCFIKKKLTWLGQTTLQSVVARLREVVAKLRAVQWLRSQPCCWFIMLYDRWSIWFEGAPSVSRAPWIICCSAFIFWNYVPNSRTWSLMGRRAICGEGAMDYSL